VETTKTCPLIPPCGGRLVDLIAPADGAQELKAYAAGLASVRLSERAACDLELLATGGFSPLDRFMGRDDLQRVLEEMRLVSGQVFPLPVTLPVEPGPAIRLDHDIALRSARNDLLAVMTITEVWEWDKDQLTEMAFGTRDPRHPLVAEMGASGRLCISGRLQVLQTPRHYDFQELRLTPSETRARLAKLGRGAVVAFNTRNPLHRIHEELTKRAVQSLDGTLLLHPVVGMTKHGDIDHYTRVRTYQALVAHYYDPSRTLLALLPLAMRFAGPREALWHAVIRRNYGANHLIVGRDHASPGSDSHGRPFYDPYAAQELVERFSGELGVGVVPFRELAYLPDEQRYEEAANIRPHARTRSISGTEVREEFLRKGKPLPSWLTRPEVAAILAEAYPPADRQGICIWFTGLSGAGKSTAAEVLKTQFLARGRHVTLLDGDVVRTLLSKGLGFSKEDRDTNIRRVGYVAAEIVHHGGVAICATVSPYRSTREEVRNLVGSDRFVEVFVDTPFEICEARDNKGMYAQARQGGIRNFTGIDDPYEPPCHPEITLDAVHHSPEENAASILHYLSERGMLRAGTERNGSPTGSEADEA